MILPEALMLESKIVTVFGSSRPKEGDAGYAEARELGYALAAKGFVVCTGGYGGVMESASRGGCWQPISERVREVELGHPSPWGEANNRMIEVASSPGAAADYVAGKLSSPL